MLKTRFVFALAAALGIAAAQSADAPGVAVDLSGATLLHRTSVSYPEGARAKGVKGSVTLEVTLDASGNVSDARVLSGPDELRKAALTSVLQWHFAHEAAGMRRQVTIAFEPSSDRQPQLPSIAAERVVESMRQSTATRTVKSIQVVGLPDSLRAELLSKLPVHEGDALSPEAFNKVGKAVKEFDEHMSVRITPGASGDAVLQIIGPEGRVPVPSNATGTSERIRVGGNVQQANLVRQERPIYPPEAKQARLQGVVKLQAIINRDGSIQQLDLLSGHPVLAPAALAAVKNWVYQPTLLNGNPVEVITQIDVNFTLSQ
jgi:TonB family protein